MINIIMKVLKSIGETLYQFLRIVYIN